MAIPVLPVRVRTAIGKSPIDPPKSQTPLKLRQLGGTHPCVRACLHTDNYYYVVTKKSAAQLRTDTTWVDNLGHTHSSFSPALVSQSENPTWLERRQQIPSDARDRGKSWNGIRGYLYLGCLGRQVR